ncbi:MAG TPA: orotate phosphoribosyltransferase [Candidatus Hydrogenedens sp.]|nr:orotate phosphoribosyltransferase [Candidatus Hydrogenedens sp.]HPP57583.1 orotate phosphoribosyltransferase [Candidatus Hydrogenedens sp.]
MTNDEVIQIFIQHKALLNGHFVYASGRHGNKFLQFSRILQYPKVTERLCSELATYFKEFHVNLVVGPATGGIVLAYEVARQLGCLTAFLEKEPDKTMAMKRGFTLVKGWKVIVVEDITTTGGSVKKCIEHLQGRGAEIVGVGCIVNRNPGNVLFDVPFFSLAEINLETWEPEECQLCKDGQSITEPDNILLT